MATINVAFFKPRSYAGYSVIGPIRASENITSSGTTAQSSNTAQTDEVVLITGQGDVNIAVGANPTATTSGMLVKSGVPTTIYIPAGEKLAVIDSA